MRSHCFVDDAVHGLCASAEMGWRTGAVGRKLDGSLEITTRSAQPVRRVCTVSKFAVGNTPPVPTTTVQPPATWNRRPPETTLGPPSHSNDRIHSSRRPVAATLNTHGVKDRG
jgi:hypothetical protein